MMYLKENGYTEATGTAKLIISFLKTIEMNSMNKFEKRCSRFVDIAQNDKKKRGGKNSLIREKSFDSKSFMILTYFIVVVQRNGTCGEESGEDDQYHLRKVTHVRISTSLD